MPGAHAQYIGCAQDRRDIDMRACSASPGALPFSALAQRVAWGRAYGAPYMATTLGYTLGSVWSVGCHESVCVVCVTPDTTRSDVTLFVPARPRPVACSLPTPPDPRPAHTRAGRRARSALTLPAESPGLLTGSRPRTRGSHAAVRDPAGRRPLSRPARPRYTRPGRTYECILVALSRLMNCELL